MNEFYKIHHSGLIEENKKSSNFDINLKKISDVRNILINKTNPNLINDSGEPLWYIAMKNKNIEGLLLLLNNEADITIRNREKESWLLSCIKFNMPQYVLILGLNKENDEWFKNDLNNNSPFFNENITEEYAKIMANKYWTELRSWKDLKNENGENPIDFFKNKGKFRIYKTFEFWKKISMRG